MQAPTPTAQPLVYGNACLQKHCAGVQPRDAQRISTGRDSLMTAIGVVRINICVTGSFVFNEVHHVDLNILLHACVQSGGPGSGWGQIRSTLAPRREHVRPPLNKGPTRRLLRRMRVGFMRPSLYTLVHALLPPASYNLLSRP